LLRIEDAASTGESHRGSTNAFRLRAHFSKPVLGACTATFALSWRSFQGDYTHRLLVRIIHLTSVGRTLRHANHILVEGDPLPVRLRRSRGHWSIEALHQVLGVTDGEDTSQVRIGLQAMEPPSCRRLAANE
jgi:hypothetical protein